MLQGLYDWALLFLASTLGPLLIWALGRTWKITRVGEEQVEAFHLRGKKVIYATWHGRMLVSIYFHRGQGIRVMVSQHRDGELIARVVKRLGYEPVRGSTSRGGVGALKEMLAMAHDGVDLAITPDGPRGPRCQVQPGVVYLARVTGRPIIPLTTGSNKKRFFSSWDRFLLPWPFSRCVLIYGKPVWVPANCSSAELEGKQRELENRLNQITEQADHFFAS